MKNVFKVILVFSISCILASCATEPKQAVFQQWPPAPVEGDEAWEILLETIRDYYPVFELEDKETGEIQSTWVVTKECWRGIYFGGMGPCERERVVAVVETLTPFKVRIAVAKQKINTIDVRGNLVQHWMEVGNNSEKEKKIYEQFMLNLTHPSR